MNTNQINTLLKSVKEIQKSVYTRIQEDRKEGKYFNIFNILGLWSEEVRLHSSFLAELLNPKGNHGCGDIFLRDFVKLFLGFKRINSYNDVEVNVEYSIGIISEDKTKGGRLDIFLKFPSENFSIIIENKIYAQDQENQLLRYYNFAENNFGYGNYKLFYLTLDGHTASKYSTGNKEFNYGTLSYQANILDWLANCRDHASSEIVRNTIFQYENLLKMLTNQYIGDAMNTEEKDKIQKKLMEANNLQIVELLASQLDETKERIFKDFIIPELGKISNINGTKLIFESSFDEENGKMNHSESGFWYYIGEEKKTYVSFIFDSNNYQNLYYGINKDSCKKQSLIKKLKLYDFKENQYWAGWKYMTEQKDFTTEDFIKYKNDPQSFKDIVVQKLEELVPLLI